MCCNVTDLATVFQLKCFSFYIILCVYKEIFVFSEAPHGQSFIKKSVLAGVAQWIECPPVDLWLLIPFPARAHGEMRTWGVGEATDLCFSHIFMFLSFFLPPFPSLYKQKTYKKRERNPLKHIIRLECSDCYRKFKFKAKKPS